MKKPNHEHIHRPNQQPHAALLIILMSFICKLPKTLIDIAAGNLATAILLSSIHIELFIIATAKIRRQLRLGQQQKPKQHSHNYRNNSQHAQIQQSSPSHERIVVKPNLLATNLVNTLMISLYITLFVSLSIYPVSVVAVSKYNHPSVYPST